MKKRVASRNPRAVNPHVRVEEEAVSAAAPSHRYSFRKWIGRALALMVGVWCGSLCADIVPTPRPSGNISLSPSSQTVSADGGTYQFVITSTEGLSYQTPSVSASWIKTTGIQIRFSTSGGAIAIQYSVAANTSSSSRTGSIRGKVSGIAYTFNITQPGRQAAYTVTFYGGGKTLGTARMEKGKNTNQAAASVYHPTRAGYELTGWYDASDKIMFDAQGRAVNGTYWNGSYVKGKSSATWKYAGNVTAYAHWKQVAKYTVTFYGGGRTLGTATMEKGKNTNQAAASVYHPTRAGYTLIGWYDANGKIMFDAQGRAVNGTYWNGSYVKGKSSATWKYAGNVTAYAYWAANTNGRGGDRNGGAVAKASFGPGLLAGTFEDGSLFLLMLDEGLRTACLAPWPDDGGMTRACEATVADDTLVLTTEDGEVYRLVWDGGNLVAMRAE